MLFVLELLILATAAGFGGFLIGQNWHRAGSLSRYPSSGPVEPARVIRLKISTAAHVIPSLLQARIENGLRQSGMLKVYGPLSLARGIALFDGGKECEVTITLHEGITRNAVQLWEMLRENSRYGVPGVDCGRIYDRGKSWCAKVYANKLRESDGLSPQYKCDYSPVTDC